jgi:hypothetical protein
MDTSNLQFSSQVALLFTNCELGTVKWDVRLRGAVHTGFWFGNLKEKYHLEDTGVDRRIILKWAFIREDGAVDWIDLVEDTDKWWALLNTVMNLGVTKKIGDVFD